ncbi:MAG TPA: hypothetical protein VNM16_12055, partial [Bacillota bacterium]|nr:hypothetical protein [Bacillota bacterium]
SQLRKLYERALRNPGSVRFEELDRLLRRWGFVRRQPGGGSSHYVYTFADITLTVVRHGGSVKPIYVRCVMEAIEGLNLPEEGRHHEEH